MIPVDKCLCDSEDVKNLEIVDAVEEEGDWSLVYVCPVCSINKIKKMHKDPNSLIPRVIAGRLCFYKKS